MKISIITLEIASFMVQQLSNIGFNTTVFTSSEDFIHHHKSGNDTDIILMDAMFQKYIGQYLYGLNSKAAIITLVQKPTTEDKVFFLNSGADACICNSTNIQELLAIIYSLYRRITNVSDSFVDSCKLCSNTRRLLLSNGSAVELTATEGIVLNALAEGAPKAVSRKQLAESLGYDYLSYDERKLEATISRLRRKIKKAVPNSDAIKAARGRGYQLIIPISTNC